MKAFIARLLDATPRQPARDYRLCLFDPDGQPTGDVYLLSIDEAAALVSWLRRRGQAAAELIRPSER